MGTSRCEHFRVDAELRAIQSAHRPAIVPVYTCTFARVYPGGSDTDPTIAFGPDGELIAPDRCTNERWHASCAQRIVGFRGGLGRCDEGEPHPRETIPAATPHQRTIAERRRAAQVRGRSRELRERAEVAVAQSRAVLGYLQATMRRLAVPGAALAA